MADELGVEITKMAASGKALVSKIKRSTPTISSDQVDDLIDELLEKTTKACA